ncbi:MAG: hypothetical protein IMW92_02155 [Bacillales bacterium]|nr:hypothetical protein [Bacillales bacterium]
MKRPEASLLCLERSQEKKTPYCANFASSSFPYNMKSMADERLGVEKTSKKNLPITKKQAAVGKAAAICC